MAIQTSADIEETRMTLRAMLEEAEEMATELVGLMPNGYTRKAENDIGQAIVALDDLAEAITGE